MSGSAVSAKRLSRQRRAFAWARDPVVGGNGVLFVAFAFAAGTFGCYLVAAGRSYDYDSSESVGAFIATRSLLDPFRRQLQYTNHPLFSFLDHLVYSASGSGQTALRVLPIAFGAATVGLLVAGVTRRSGLLSGLAGGLVLAANPTFAELSRSVRGYSLLCLCTVASTILLLGLLARPSRWRAVGYSVVLAMALATHLYAVFVFISQVAFVTARRRADRRWVARWLAAAIVGGLAYVGLASTMLRAAADERRHFVPGFPLRVARMALGSTSLSVAGLAVLCLLGCTLLPRRDLVATLAMAGGALTAVWLVFAPTNLYPRFFIWAVPAVAFTCVLAITRWPLLTPLLVVAVVPMALLDAGRWAADPLPGPAAAAAVRTARARGLTPCVLPGVRGALMAYTTPPREVTRTVELARCGLAIAVSIGHAGLREKAGQLFRYRWRLAAATPFLVYSRLPQTELTPHPRQ